ncbi:MAG: tetratricopeptide repeat protein [Candidatus Omnitrophica bacterium]|nr:tetratricopeptide repeat protein [Candidatus Omnitrophota bacterium]
MYNTLHHMRFLTYPYQIIRIAVSILVLGLASLVSAYAAEGPACNQGAISAKNIPEYKKGTVIFGNNPQGAVKKGVAPAQDQEKNLSELQRTARLYRSQGLKAQEMGNINEALVFYQKAAHLDPSYGVVFNDLGVILEAQGRLVEAEQAYRKSIEIDPQYLSGYSNLALFYENQRDLTKAAEYWKKRAQLGSPEDPWTEKAARRYEDIRVVVAGRPLSEELKEQAVVDLLKDVANQKNLQQTDNKELAKSYFQKAQANYKKGDEVTALKQSLDAKQLDPTNKEIQEFVDKVQIRLLSK